MLPRVNVATKIQSSHSWQWLIQKEKKVPSLFGGICNVELRFGQRRGCLVEWWQLLLSPSHSNTLDVTRPQTNSGSVCVSLCAGQVLFDTVYLLVKGTCASTKKKKKKNRTGSFKRKETVLVAVPVHRCVELSSIECVHDEVRDTDSDYVMRKPSRC